LLSLVSTRTGSTVALGATPNDEEATVPATWVPWVQASRVWPGTQLPEVQSAPARTRPSKSGCDPSTQPSSTATTTPAPERPAG
jgi:hypothetical protein